VLVDTSVWVDHLRRRNATLSDRLEATQVWTHCFVIGELACGNLAQRSEILTSLAALPQAPLIDHAVVLEFVRSRRLMGRGLGWVDMHLLASAMLAGLSFWTLDRRLASAARGLGMEHA
jgi:predicted nucleic acid-binding protein